jgi:small-conductance mechanosensitive channel
MNEKLKEIMERAMQPFSLLALAPEMRQAIIRACEEAESHTKASAADAMAAQMELNALLLQTIAKLETENQQFRQRLDGQEQQNVDYRTDNLRLRQQLEEARVCEKGLREQIVSLYEEVKRLREVKNK